jgi:MoaA/NifB/PqqE/SkfB family radical SAM enzyme
MLTSPLCGACVHLVADPTREESEDFESALERGFLHAQVEVSAECNYACLGCPSQSIRARRDSMPDLERLSDNISAILPRLRVLTCFNYGEPLLNPQFSEFVARCRAQNDRLEIGVATNGTLLTRDIASRLVEARVNWVLVSLHGGPGTDSMLRYARRGADYDGVLENLRVLKEVRDERGSGVPVIGLRAILFNWNDTDELMDQFRADARTIGFANPTINWTTEDGYHWILDSRSPSARSSQRFLSGNDEYRWLKNRNELC